MQLDIRNSTDFATDDIRPLRELDSEVGTRSG
jgi:hypothetical protein